MLTSTTNYSKITTAELTSKIESGEVRQGHKVMWRGYVSRKSDGAVLDYKGKFGEGFILLTPNWDSSRYCFATYYINAKTLASV